MKKLMSTIIVLMPLTLACSGSGNASDCVSHDSIVEVIENWVEAISESDEDKYMTLVHSSFDELKRIEFRHDRSLYELSRLVEVRLGKERFDELFQGHLLEWNGVTFINTFFRDDWSNVENIEIVLEPRYDGTAVQFRQIVGAFLFQCIDGDLRIDLDAQYINPLDTGRILVEAAIERNLLLIQRLEEEDVRDVSGLRAVINERDWMVRIPE